MNLLIDMGNTRLKWGVIDAQGIVTGLPIANAKIDRFTLAQAWHSIPPPTRLAISCVSADQLFDLVISVITELWPGTPIFRAKSEKTAFGVCNAYQDPEKLGVDRWLCLLAGYQHYRNPLCIVDCGTAITLDVVDASGMHQGGLISPGLQLMKKSLAKGTENLKPSNTVYPFGLASFTDAAIYNGTLFAACGLIEFVLKNQPDSLQLLLTGGDANIIATQLSHPSIIEPNLVLQGLALTLQQPT